MPRPSSRFVPPESLDRRYKSRLAQAGALAAMQQAQALGMPMAPAAQPSGLPPVGSPSSPGMAGVAPQPGGGLGSPLVGTAPPAMPASPLPMAPAGMGAPMPMPAAAAPPMPQMAEGGVYGGQGQEQYSDDYYGSLLDWVMPDYQIIDLVLSAATGKPPTMETPHFALGGAMPAADPLADAQADAFGEEDFPEEYRDAPPAPEGFVQWLAGADPTRTNDVGRALIAQYQRTPGYANGLYQIARQIAAASPKDVPPEVAALAGRSTQ